MTIEELKAKAYDTLASIEFLQAQLRELNKQIGEKIGEGKNIVGEKNKIEEPKK